jgi:hypothetical protein
VIRELIRYAWDFENTNASQVFLIPFVSGALIYWNRDSIFRDVRFAPWAGVSTMMLGLTLPVAVRASGVPLSMGDDLSLTVASVVAVWIGGFSAFLWSVGIQRGHVPIIVSGLLYTDTECGHGPPGRVASARFS